MGNLMLGATATEIRLPPGAFPPGRNGLPGGSLQDAALRAHLDIPSWWNIDYMNLVPVGGGHLGFPGVWPNKEGNRPVHVRRIREGRLAPSSEGDAWFWIGGSGAGKNWWFPRDPETIFTGWPVMLCEGETSAATLSAIGYPVIATTGSSWREDDAESLERVLRRNELGNPDRIIAWTDPDPGGVKWATQLSRIVPPEDRDRFFLFPTVPVLGVVPAANEGLLRDPRGAWRKLATLAPDHMERWNLFVEAVDAYAVPLPPPPPEIRPSLEEEVAEAIRELRRHSSRWRSPRSGSPRDVEPEEVLRHLDGRTTVSECLIVAGAVRMGSGFRCPWHEDRSPSLSVVVSGGKEVGYRCHAEVCGRSGDLVQAYAEAYYNGDRRAAWRDLCDEIRGGS